MQKMLTIAALLGLAAGSAMAADMPLKAPAYAPAPAAFSWTGCYIGAGGGYGMSDSRTQSVVTTTGVGLTGTLDQGAKGWFGTVQGGCDYQVQGSWVIGAFADGDWDRIRGRHQLPGALGVVSGDQTLDRAWAAGGRLGYVVTPTLLTFFSAGYTEARFDGTNYQVLNSIPAGIGLPAQTYSGYFIGGGVEYAFNWLPIPGLFWKTEYRYSDFRTQSPGDFATATGAGLGVSERTHPSVQTIRSELVWRFGGGAPVRAAY